MGDQPLEISIAPDARRITLRDGGRMPSSISCLVTKDKMCHSGIVCMYRSQTPSITVEFAYRVFAEGAREFGPCFVGILVELLSSVKWQIGKV